MSVLWIKSAAQNRLPWKDTYRTPRREIADLLQVNQLQTCYRSINCRLATGQSIADVLQVNQFPQKFKSHLPPIIWLCWFHFIHFIGLPLNIRTKYSPKCPRSFKMCFNTQYTPSGRGRQWVPTNKNG